MLNDAKKAEKKSWHMGTHLRVLSQSYLMTVLDGYPKYLHPCSLDESSLSMGRVIIA